VHSVDTSHPRYSAPGTIYEEPPQELLNVLQNGAPILTQPYTDEYGSFVSYFKPVKNFEDNKIVGVMGVDVDYVWALNQIREDRLYTLTITTFLYLFSSILFFYLHKRQQSKQELSEGQKRFESIVQTSSDAIMTLEPPDWIFTGGNPATVRMFNAKNEAEFVSKSPGQLSPEKQPDGQLSMEKAKKMIEKALLKGSNFFEWTHKKITGETCPTESLRTRFEIDGEPMVQATVRDISKRKKDEGALEEQKRDLEELNSLMVGREIKIIELKEEIARLKEELGKK
jgi:PAS domain-containing protein